MRSFVEWLEQIEPISIGKFEGSPSEEFQAVNLIQGGRQVGRMNFGMHKSFRGVENGKIVYDYYGTIDDVHLSVRGTNAMRLIYPQIEQRLKGAGATRIKLNTTDDPVGLKVWQPLGFQLVGRHGTNGAKIWEKIL